MDLAIEQREAKEKKINKPKNGTIAITHSEHRGK